MARPNSLQMIVVNCVVVHGSSTVILDYASSLLANALNRHYYFVLLGAAKNIDG